MKTILVDAIGAFILKGEGIYQPMYEMLETFPNRKIILTGANDEQIKEFGLVNLPYELFTLKHNPEKSDPEYFKTMLITYNLKPEGVVFFEHSKEAAESARTVGIKTYYYDSDKKDLESLKKFLLENL